MSSLRSLLPKSAYRPCGTRSAMCDHSIILDSTRYHKRISRCRQGLLLSLSFHCWQQLKAQQGFPTIILYLRSSNFRVFTLASIVFISMLAYPLNGILRDHSTEFFATVSLRDATRKRGSLPELDTLVEVSIYGFTCGVCEGELLISDIVLIRFIDRRDLAGSIRFCEGSHGRFFPLTSQVYFGFEWFEKMRIMGNVNLI